QKVRVLLREGFRIGDTPCRKQVNDRPYIGLPDEFRQGRLVELPRGHKTIEDLLVRDMDVLPADDRLDVLDVPAVQEYPDVPLCLLFMGESKDLPEYPGEIYPKGVFNAEYPGVPAFCY